MILTISILCACSSPKYIYNKSSYNRQKELIACRGKNIAKDISLGLFSACTAAALDVDFGYYPAEQQFRKLKLINSTTDTMYVNMLTDVFWDTNNYCDFTDIRIPPKKSTKILVPLGTNYNIYFSTTPQKDDDELLHIFTSDLKRISLSPQMTHFLEAETK
jgi:hypothetical protein